MSDLSKGIKKIWLIQYHLSFTLKKKALKEYIKANDHPKLAAFVIDNKQTVKEWLMYFETLTDATNSLKRKMQAMYKEVHPKKKEQPTVNVDISVLFAEAKSNGTATVVGNKIVEEATKTAGQHLTQTLKVKIGIISKPFIV